MVTNKKTKYQKEEMTGKITEPTLYRSNQSSAATVFGVLISTLMSLSIESGGVNIYICMYNRVGQKKKY